MKKAVLCLVVLLAVGTNVYSATAQITAQIVVGDVMSMASITSSFNDATDFIIYMDVEKLKEQYRLTRLEIDTFERNSWANYLVNLVINNTRWYTHHFGKVYRTNLISNTGRKYVVYTCIKVGNYYTDTLEATNINYIAGVYEIR